MRLAVLPWQVWQRNYHDIIRDEAEVGRIQQDILDNPVLQTSEPLRLVTFNAVTISEL